MNPTKNQGTLTQALIVLAFLISTLAMSVYLYGDGSSSGANQIALILSAALASLIAWRNGWHWSEIEESIIKGVSASVVAILILLLVGSLIGSWILSGTVPTLIYYGLNLIEPSLFYATCCLVCAVVTLGVGSSWTVAGTLGIAFMGMTYALQLNPAICAGAVISGAYFGDKLSPLSDTTNLVSAVTESNLFAHIRNMLRSTLPSIIIAVLLFVWIGYNIEEVDSQQLQQTSILLAEKFDVGLHLLIPIIVLFTLAWLRLPAIPTMIIGILIGSLFALIFQQDVIASIDSTNEFEGWRHQLSVSWSVLFDGFQSNSGHEALDNLLSRGGMSSMLNTVWLIISAMIFGTVMERSGMLSALLSSLLNRVKSTTGLLVTTLFTGIGTNIITADQYIALILPGKMYKLEYRRRKLDSLNLSRVLEDSSTLTSPLIPWNTCGAYMAVTLGVATFEYLPYAFFNLLGPVLSIFYALAHIYIIPLNEDEASPKNKQGI